MSDAWVPPEASGPDENAWTPPEARGPGRVARLGTQAGKTAGPYEEFSQGLSDVIRGGAQLAMHALSSGATDSDKYPVDKWMIEKTKALDKSIAGEESQYQAARKASGRTGFDYGRLAGNIANPVNYLLVGRAGAGAGALGRIAGSAEVGGLANALNPVTDGDFFTEKAKQVGTGAAAGGVLTGGTEAIAKVAAPTFRATAKLLMDEGVKLTPGQMAGGAAKRLEDASTSIPLMGDAIKMGQKTSIDTFNRAATNRALAHIGEKLPPNVPVGHAAIDHAATKLGAAYDKLLPNLTAQIDKDYRADIDAVQALGANLPAAQKGQLDRIIASEIVSRFTPHGMGSGFTAKEIESQLGQIGSDMGRSSDYDVRRLGSAVKELQAATRRMVERVNPAHAGELQKINAGWANLLRVQRAAGSVGAKDGVFSPAQLMNAVKALDKSKNNAAFARGHALMQDLADAAKDVLPSTVPDSGSPFRGMVGLGALGGAAAVNPMAAAGAGAMALPYTSHGMNLLRQFAIAAPHTRNYLSQAVKRIGPFAAPAAALGAQSVSGP